MKAASLLCHGEAIIGRQAFSGFGLVGLVTNPGDNPAGREHLLGETHGFAFVTPAASGVDAPVPSRRQLAREKAALQPRLERSNSLYIALKSVELDL